MIIEIIDRNPELNIRILKDLELYDSNRVRHIINETGEMPIQRIGILSEQEKKLITDFILQASKYFKLFGDKLDIP